MANNHGADYGPVGLADSLAAARTSPVPVVGIGENRRAAFAPYRVSIRGTDLAFLAADGSFREGASNVWAAGPTTPGIAAAHADRPRALLAAVRAAGRQVDVVVVYLHWGAEWPRAARPTSSGSPRRPSPHAGADVIVGTHAHVLLGSGWLGRHLRELRPGQLPLVPRPPAESGVLRVRIRDGEVVDDSWVPARIGRGPAARARCGAARAGAVADWRSSVAAPAWLPAARHPHRLRATIIGAAHRSELRDRMRFSHRPGCPVPLRDLRSSR